MNFKLIIINKYARPQYRLRDTKLIDTIQYQYRKISLISIEYRYIAHHYFQVRLKNINSDNTLIHYF